MATAVSAPPPPPGFTLDAAPEASAPISGGLPPPPPGFTLDQPVAAPETQQAVQEDAPKPSLAARLLKGLDSKYNPFRFGMGGPAMAETVTNLASGMLAAPASGVSGLATAAVPGGRTGAQGVEDVGAAMTYQPKTEGGQMLTNAATWPFQKLVQGAQAVAGPTAEGMPAVARDTRPISYSPGSGGFPLAGRAPMPALATAIDTGIQAAPALLFRGRGKPAEAQIANPRAAEIIDAARQAGETVAPARANAQAAAESYVATRTNLDWNSLAPQVRARITDIAEKSGNLEKLDPKALERSVALGSLRVPTTGTRGQLTRDPVDLRNENNVAATESGKAIRDKHVEQNRALVQNLDLLKERTRGRADSAEQVGDSVQSAARAKLKAKEAQVKGLYQKAEAAGELQGRVSPKSLVETIERSPDKTHYGWVESWLKKNEVVAETAGGGRSIKKLTLKELEDLRQAAVARAMNGGTEGYYAGKVIKAIDQATDGAGGSAYQAARRARREQAMEFDEQAGVNRLVDNSSRTDRAVALEDTWRRTVKSGSIEDLQKVKRSLLTGGTPATRAAGKKAWQDLRAQTVQHIIDEATKSVTRFEDGSPNITPAAMERAIKGIGEQKLAEIFSPQMVRELKNIMEATRILKTDPPPSFKGSPTMPNFIAFLEKHIGSVPGVGDAVVGTARGMASLKKLGEATRVTNRALSDPLTDAKVKPTNSLDKSPAIKANALGLQAEQQRKRAQ